MDPSIFMMVAQAIIEVVIENIAQPQLDWLRERLRGGNPQKLALKDAIQRAYQDYEVQFPDPESLKVFKERRFLENQEVVKELAKYLTSQGKPDVSYLSQLWHSQFPGESLKETLIQERLAFFLWQLDLYIKDAAPLKPLVDSQALQELHKISASHLQMIDLLAQQGQTSSEILAVMRQIEEIGGEQTILFIQMYQEILNLVSELVGPKSTSKRRFTDELARHLVLDYNLQRIPVESFSFVGYPRVFLNNRDFIALMEVGLSFDLHRVDALVDEFFHLISHTQSLLNITAGPSPTGLIIFVIMEDKPETFIDSILSKSRISHGLTHAGKVVVWAIDLPRAKVYTNRWLVSAIPPVIVLPATLRPSVEYLNQRIEKYNRGQ